MMVLLGKFSKAHNMVRQFAELKSMEPDSWNSGDRLAEIHFKQLQESAEKGTLKEETGGILVKMPSSSDEIAGYVQETAVPVLVKIFLEDIENGKVDYKDPQVAIQSFGIAFGTKLLDLLKESI